MKNPYSNLKFKNKRDKQAVCNLLPSWAATYADGIPEAMFKTDLLALERLAKPTVLEEQLRSSFWVEYQRCVESGEAKMNLANVYGGYCDVKYFKKLIAKTSKFAYILSPTPPLELQLEDLIQLGTIQMRRILTAIPVDNEGKIDAKVAKAQIDVWKQAIQMKNGTNHNLNINQKSLSIVANQPLTQEQAKDVTDQVQLNPPAQAFSMADLEAAALAEIAPPNEVVEVANNYVSEVEDE